MKKLLLLGLLLVALNSFSQIMIGQTFKYVTNRINYEYSYKVVDLDTLYATVGSKNNLTYYYYFNKSTNLCVGYIIEAELTTLPYFKQMLNKDYLSISKERMEWYDTSIGILIDIIVNDNNNLMVRFWYAPEYDYKNI